LKDASEILQKLVLYLKKEHHEESNIGRGKAAPVIDLMIELDLYKVEFIKLA